MKVEIILRTESDCRTVDAWVGKTLKTRDVNKALKMIEQDLEYLLKEWHEYRSKANG